MNFFVFVIFSLSPLSLSLSPAPVYLSFSHPCLSFSLFSPAHVSLSIFLSPIHVVFLSYSHSYLPVYLSLTPVSSSPSLWLSLSLSLFHPCLSSYLPLSHHVSLFLWFSLSLSLSPSKEREHKIIL